MIDPRHYMYFQPPRIESNPSRLSAGLSTASVNFVGARTGATGTIEQLASNPPKPKAWLKPALVKGVVSRLKADQHRHTRLDLESIIHTRLFEPSNDRYRVVWSTNMITSAGVSKIKRKSAEAEFVLHLRDGEEERTGSQPYMRQIIESLYAKGGRAQESIEDFLYLILVHEASEIHQRDQAETLAPNIKAEIRALIEEAKAYFALPPQRRKSLGQLYKLLDGTTNPGLQLYSRVLNLFESIGQRNFGTIESLLALIDFVLTTPDYAREAKRYFDDRTKLQLAKSLYVDVLHDFAGSSRADDWVRDVEVTGAFSESVVTFNYTDNSKALSAQAEEIFLTAARTLETLRQEDSEPESLPSRTQIKQVIEGFNNEIEKLDPLKKQLRLDEVLGIPAQLRDALEDNSLNRHMSYMDRYGIYHSLDLSRLDLRGLDLHSGIDQRTASDKDREINSHKDERTNLRGAHMVGSDLSERANFSSAHIDFMIASYSNLREIVFTRTKAIGMVFYGANANEGQFERARMTAVDARGMSANFARIQMKETDINGMKIWQSDVPSWQRAYVDITQSKTPKKIDDSKAVDRESLKAELDFLEDSFLDELEEIEETGTSQNDEKWIELREVDGQLELLKGRGVVFYSKEQKLEYSDSA